MQSFLGLAGYVRAFIPANSRVVFPLTQLTEKSRDVKWTQECEAAFKDLKTAFTSAPILVYPGLAQNATLFILDTDVSGRPHLRCFNLGERQREKASDLIEQTPITLELTALPSRMAMR